MASPVINSFTTCPADCDDDNLLPAIPAIQDCPSYAQDRSQVHTLYLMPQVAGVSSPDPFTNFATTPTVTALALDNTGTTNVKAKFLVGEGGIAEPTETILEYPMLQEKVTERQYQLVFTVKNLVQAQYDFLLQMQCGNTDITFYYASGMDANQWVYGKQGGIVPKKVTVSFPKGAGKDDRDSAIIKIDWWASGDPDRRINPYA
jgi:hypothetical protein